MLFDPRSFVPAVDAGHPNWAPARQPPIARRRPAHDLLTLPTVPQSIPARARLSYGDEVNLVEVVRAQFGAGVLRASDVSNPSGAGDAFAQAMFAWLGARMPRCQRLDFSFSLIDIGAAQDQLMQFGWDDQIDAPLYLAIELPGDEIYYIGDERANALRAAHPHLLYTAMSLINEASPKSLFLRTPEVLLDLFARWHWEWDSTLTDDKDAEEYLRDNCGMDETDVARYLPSVVRPELAPDDVLPGFFHRGPKSRRLHAFGNRKLYELSHAHDGWIKDLCAALAELRLVLNRNGERSAISESQWAEPAYAGATIAFKECDYVGELLDDYYQGINSGGEATLYQCFIPIAAERSAIHQQFKDLGGMLKIIAALDRVLTLISD